MGDAGKTLIAIGLVLIVVGCVVTLAGKIPGAGKLPGDIYIKKEHFSFYFPLATCILLSILLSLVMFFFSKR